MDSKVVEYVTLAATFLAAFLINVYRRLAAAKIIETQNTRIPSVIALPPIPQATPQAPVQSWFQHLQVELEMVVEQNPRLVIKVRYLP